MNPLTQQKKAQLAEIKAIENSLDKGEQLFRKQISRECYEKAVHNLNVIAKKADISILAGMRDKKSILSTLDEKIIFNILKIKSNLKPPPFKEYCEKYLVRITRKHIDQTDLVSKYGVPIHCSMKYKFAALDIRAPMELSKEELARVSKIAYKHTCEQYEIVPHNKKLKAELAELHNQKIQFTVFGASVDETAFNIDFK